MGVGACIAASPRSFSEAGMDTIRFELKHPNEVAILINDRDLIEMLREVELPFATREGHPSMAGD